MENQIIEVSKNEGRCHYCGSANVFYKKFYIDKASRFPQDPFYGQWLACSQPFSSCSNVRCPYHFRLVSGEVLAGLFMDVRFESVPGWMVKYMNKTRSV